MDAPTQAESDRSLAEKITRRTTKTTGPILRVDWAGHGTETNGKPGTLWKATTSPRWKEPGEPGRRFFEVFTPAPKNSRQTVKAILGRHLRRESLLCKGATVIEIGA